MNEINLKTLFGGDNDSFDVLSMSRFVAGWDTAVYYNSHARQARSFGSKWDLHSYGVKMAPREGHILELGVASGATVNFIAKADKRPIYGFDVFTGLPEVWRTGFGVGAFDQKGVLPEVENNVSLVPGLFEDTLPLWLADHPENIAYLHVDSDLYSSAHTIFDKLGHRIVAGTVIAFDEYWNFPGWQNDVFKAFREFIAWSKLHYVYEGFVSSHQQVLVKITA